MIYLYSCGKCQTEFDVIKPLAEIDNPEFCPGCKRKGKREFAPRAIYLNKTSVHHPEYNPGLGCVVKNERHKKYLMQSKGLVEVGNDYGSGEKMQEKFEKDRAEKKEKEWEKL